MIHFDPLSFLLGASVASGMLFIAFVVRDAWRKYVGHHEPIKAEAPVDKTREAVLVETAKAIIEHKGRCVWADYSVPCSDCPADMLHGEIGDTEAYGGNRNPRLVAWLEKWLASHESLRHRPKK